MKLKAIIWLYNSVLHRGNAPGKAKWKRAAGKQLWNVLFTVSVTSTGKGCPRGCGVSILGGTQKPSGDGPVQLAL